MLLFQYLYRHRTAFQTWLVTWYFSNCLRNKTLSRNLLNGNWLLLRWKRLHKYRQPCTLPCNLNLFSSRVQSQSSKQKKKHENHLCIIYQLSYFMVLWIIPLFLIDSFNWFFSLTFSNLYFISRAFCQFDASFVHANFGFPSSSSFLLPWYIKF